MQAIAPVTPANLLAQGQSPLIKFEIYVAAAWVNLGTLDGKNYVEGVSISLGGAGVGPNPIGGTWSAMLSNENGIFHPDHPTSGYEDYCKTGRLARVSIGATYNSTDYYWQRLIGRVGEPDFEAGGQKITLSGADYMKVLEETEFANLDPADIDNYWGAKSTFDSISSDGLSGIEQYNEADALDITGEANNMTNWVTDEITLTSEADAGGGSVYVGKLVTTDEEPYGPPAIYNANIFTPTAGKRYLFRFKYKRVSGAGAFLRIRIRQNDGGYWYELGEKEDLWSLSWTDESVAFTAVTTDVIQIWIDVEGGPIGSEMRIDQFSIFEFIPYEERYYELPAGAKGPFRVILDGVDVWQGEEDEGWGYEETTRRVFFDHNKEVDTGTNNLDVYYFTAEAPENAVADILVKCGLYADRATALAAMDYTATGFTIDKIWFKAGSACLNAITKLCERCDYRFYFTYDGTPVFKPKPTPGATVFTFSDQKHIVSVRNFQDENEVKNRIIIEGHKRAEPVNKEETLPPELRGEAHDQTSIDAYGERTLTIKNHLFQDQASIDTMKASLLTEYKDPKWYADVEIKYCAAPLELADKISWKERLSPTLELTRTGIIRDIKIDSFNTIYKCEKL